MSRPQETRKAKRVAPISLIIIFAMLVVAVLSGLLFFVHDRHAASTPSSLLSAAKKNVAAKYSNIAVNTAWPAQMGSGIAIAAPGYNFQINSESLPSVYFMMKEDSGASAGSSKLSKAASPKDVRPTIDAAITHAGYTAYIDNPNTATYINAQNDRCLSIFDGPHSVLTLSCYTPKDVSAAAMKLKPFVDAYSKANTAVASSAMYGPVTIKSQERSGVIKPSYTPGYNIAEAVISNGSGQQLALFYNKNAGPWQFITQASDEFGFTCAAYTANPDVRKAMYDQICLSDHGQVRLDTNNRATQ